MAERTETFASEELFSPPTSSAPLVTAITAALLAGGVVFTQLLAGRLGHHPALGPPLFPRAVPAALGLAALTLTTALLILGLARSRTRLAALTLLPIAVALAFSLQGPLYSPERGAVWAWRFARSAEIRPLLARPALAALATAGLLSLAAVALDGRRRRREPAALAHGSARYATAAELTRAGLLDGTEGLLLGAWGRGRRRRLLADPADHHALIVLPPGGGKTSGPIVGTLLGNPDWSAFIIDPKGELWDLTSGYRGAGARTCIRFAPHSDGGTPRWNCLAEVEQGPREVKLLSAIADNLISYPATAGGDSHWISAARTLFRCLALHVLYTHNPPSMPGLRQLLNDPQGDGGIEALFRTLMTADHDRNRHRGWLNPSDGKPTTTHPEVARIARALLETPPRERGSIISTLNQFLAVWGDELVAANTATSDFNLRDVAARSAPVSLYVSVPFDELARLGPLIRVMLSLLTVQLTGEDGFADQAAAGRRRLLLVLDEFAALGRIPILEEMLAFLRGYGVTAMIVLQDLNQLRRLYSDRESISGICQTHVLGATQNTATREHASRLAGEATVRYRRRSVHGGRHSPLKPRATLNDAEVRRPLVTEGEVGTLPADRLLIFKTGMAPILAYKHPYFRDPELLARAALPPSSRWGRVAAPPAFSAGSDRQPPAPPPSPLPARLPPRDLDVRDRDLGEELDR